MDFPSKIYIFASPIMFLSTCTNKELQYPYASGRIVNGNKMASYTIIVYIRYFVLKFEF